MPRYLVTWEIDIEDADSPEDAARQAFAHMQRPGTSANVFKVKTRDASGVCQGITTVDLDELDGETT